jgi:hypothetical protein
VNVPVIYFTQQRHEFYSATGKSSIPESKAFTGNGNSGLIKLVKANDKIENQFSVLPLS